jgi:DNA replicative helicase MCM subunit Mcm2 (Cdc46/Mcm family)
VIPDKSKSVDQQTLKLQENPEVMTVLAFKREVKKFVEKTAPVALYTSGKGSSAAGLTASVIRDNSSVSSCLRFCTGRIFVFRFILPFTKSYE